jgi:aspartate/methionine/tyrosine aminotransferase
MPVMPTDTRTYITTSQEMEEAVLAAESKGVHARMLLVTNPGNPLGTLYPEATLKVMI